MVCNRSKIMLQHLALTLLSHQFSSKLTTNPPPNGRGSVRFDRLNASQLSHGRIEDPAKRDLRRRELKLSQSGKVRLTFYK